MAAIRASAHTLLLPVLCLVLLASPSCAQSGGKNYTARVTMHAEVGHLQAADVNTAMSELQVLMSDGVERVAGMSVESQATCGGVQCEAASTAQADTNNCFCCCTSDQVSPAPGIQTCIYGFSCSTFCQRGGFGNGLSCTVDELKPLEPTIVGPTTRASVGFLLHLTFAYGVEASTNMKGAFLAAIPEALATAAPLPSDATFAVGQWAEIPRGADGRASAVVHLTVSSASPSALLSFARGGGDPQR